MTNNFIAVTHHNVGGKIPLTPQTTFADLAHAAWQLLHLPYGERVIAFKAGDFLDSNYLCVSNDSDMEKLFSRSGLPTFSIFTQGTPLYHLRLGSHPLYEHFHFVAQPSLADVVSAARDRFGRDRVPATVREVHLVEGGGGCFSRIASEADWVTYAVPLLSTTRAYATQREGGGCQGPVFHVGQLGPTRLTAPALSHLSSSLGTLSLFPPPSAKTFSNLGSSTDDGSDGVSTVGSEGTVQF